MEADAQASTSSTFLPTVHPSATFVAPSYFDVGDCSQVCEYCGARFWFAEHVRPYSPSGKLRYNQCCKSGEVRLRHPPDPPPSIKNLFSSSDFLRNIRPYNSMFSMTSFGASVDESINLRPGPYVFRVSGQICHRLGSLLPDPGTQPRFLQMYVYDTENELTNRLSFFGEHGTSSLNTDTVQLLSCTLDECNDLVKLFRTARDLCLRQDFPTFSIRLYSGSREVRYDIPAAGTIGGIVYGNTSISTDFDIIIRDKNNTAQRVNKLHPSYMSLQYPLLFLFGEQGWSPQLRLRDNGSRNRNLTMDMYYSYHIHDRANMYTLLFRGGRLFQQFLVDAYICIEQGRFDYIVRQQSRLRNEYLQGVHDAIVRGDSRGHDIGKRVILPSSFTGGPRYMYKHYQDALAICRVHGNPQYFITFTCNVKWPEIQRYMSAFAPLTAQDRPDIISRVFKLKVDAFMQYLRSGTPFGEVVADLYTIEFQKRGLPHCHTLLWVKAPFKIQSAAQIDTYISAEVPNPTADPQLYHIVSELMLHGPCGLARPNSPCMVNNICSKRYPRRFEPVTRFDNNGYVLYKRSADGFTVIKNNVTMDSTYVVPYNKKLLLHFNAHINVEYCGWNMLIKYLFKYISKGTDRIRFTVTNKVAASTSTQHDSSCVDEVKNFTDGRFICPHEASWRILDFPIHCRHPPVQILSVHLENMQNLQFKDRDRLRNIVTNAFMKKTTLTEWLEKNKSDPDGHHLRYIDYPAEYRWDLASKSWMRRVSLTTASIGRLIYIHPSSGDAFYLRMLLNHQKGCRTFADIRTVHGEVCSTYRTACEKLGLLDDNQEWEHAFADAASWATAKELRDLFTHMLLFCEVPNPLHLWTTHWRSMADDMLYNIQHTTNFHQTFASDEDMQQYTLLEIQLLLNASTTSSSLENFGLPLPRPDLLSSLNNRLLMEEKNYDIHQIGIEHETLRNALNVEQSRIYDFVINSNRQRRQVLLFVYGHGGTGKTYLWTTITYALRSTSQVVLIVAASGIASLLLPSGRTAHSRFKILLDLTDESICHIKKNTQLANLLRETSLIIWDEAPMSDRRCFESLDKTLKDILDVPNTPFGGKSLLLGGDFRQTLPVKPKASKNEVINSSITKSYLWQHFKVWMLTENMRLHRLNVSDNERSDIAWFSNWLLSIGDGNIGEPVTDSDLDTKNINIPSKFLFASTNTPVSSLIDFIYDADTLKNPSISKLSEKAIICPKNNTVDEINALVLQLSEGSTVSYLSSDSIVPHANDRGDTETLYPLEYLNMLNFTSIPPHQLLLKTNIPIILLRNINQTTGLCNGTRLLITRLLPKVIEARL